MLAPPGHHPSTPSSVTTPLTTMTTAPTIPTPHVALNPTPTRHIDPTLCPSPFPPLQVCHTPLHGSAPTRLALCHIRSAPAVCAGPC